MRVETCGIEAPAMYYGYKLSVCMLLLYIHTLPAWVLANKLCEKMNLSFVGDAALSVYDDCMSSVDIILSTRPFGPLTLKICYLCPKNLPAKIQLWQKGYTIREFKFHLIDYTIEIQGTFFWNAGKVCYILILISSLEKHKHKMYFFSTEKCFAVGMQSVPWIWIVVYHVSEVFSCVALSS